MSAKYPGCHVNTPCPAAGWREKLSAHAHNILHAQAFMAILAAGAIAVPLNLRWSFSEAQASVQSVGAQILFIDEDMVAQFGGLACEDGRRCITLGASMQTAASGAGLPTKDSTWCPVGDLIRQGAGECALDIQTAEDGAAMICCTSGTAGAPKGAVLSHAALHAQVGCAAHSHHLPFPLGLCNLPMQTLEDMKMPTKGGLVPDWPRPQSQCAPVMKGNAVLCDSSKCVWPGACKANSGWLQKGRCVPALRPSVPHWRDVIHVGCPGSRRDTSMCPSDQCTVSLTVRVRRKRLRHTSCWQRFCWTRGS